jgi:hypothetical protein
MSEEEGKAKLFGLEWAKDMLVRDYIAIHVDISWRDAQEMLLAIMQIGKAKEAAKIGETPGQQAAIRQFSDMIPPKPPLAAEVAEFRALLKYIQADMMMNVRSGLISDELALATGLKKDTQPGTQEKRWDEISKEL